MLQLGNLFGSNKYEKLNDETINKRDIKWVNNGSIGCSMEMYTCNSSIYGNVKNCELHINGIIHNLNEMKLNKIKYI